MIDVTLDYHSLLAHNSQAAACGVLALTGKPIKQMVACEVSMVLSTHTHWDRSLVADRQIDAETSSVGQLECPNLA